MTASRVAEAAHGAGLQKSASDGMDRETNPDDLEGVEEEEVVVVPLRVDPLPQQNASPVDIDKGLRLIQSCRDGDSAAVQRQIVEGSPAGFVTKSGWTPLAAAAYGGKGDIVRYLLDLGADGMYSKSVRRYASSYSQQQQSNASGPNNGVSHGDSTSSLDSSKASVSSSQLELHLASNGSNNNIVGDGDTKNGDGAVVAPLPGGSSGAGAAKKLLGNGSNTPLHWACYKGHAEIVTILLHAGYAIEDVDPIGNRALHLACSGGYRDVMEILLANSAAVDQRNRYGNRPLDLATDIHCRKLLQKFQSQTACEWCKETFNRIRHPSLCQHCHNVYCDVKPCSSITEIVTPVDVLRPGTASTGAVLRSMRYCQECATEMGKTEQDLRNILDTKLELIRNTVELITKSSMPASASSSRPSTQAEGSRPDTTSTPPEAVEPVDPSAEADDSDVVISLSVSGDMEGVEPPPSAEELETPRPVRRLLKNEEIFRVLTLSQTDAEALYTSIEAAQLKAVDRELVERAKQTYRQLVAHVALQEEVKSLMVVRPIAVRSLVEPLKTALANAKREAVSHGMLMLGVQVIRSAEAECTLYGCEAMCAKIELGTKKYRRDIARLEASISESQAAGVNEKLLASAVSLRDRLNAEVQLQSALQPFIPLASTNEAGVETVTGYRFEDGEVPTLLQALELRNQQVQSAVDFGSVVEGVSAVLLEEGGNVLKQLKKDIKDEMKNEEERRRLEEEAALKAAKKGKKGKKA